MPPRFAYWTIIADGLPTAFRATDREELMPTFHRLKEKHPDAEMKWFARGKLWDSPEAARPPRRENRDDRGDATSRDRGRRAPRDGERDRGAGPSRFRPSAAGRAHAQGAKPAGSREQHGRGEHRGRDWRPGGEHRDPRQAFKDAKQARNQRWREEKFARKHRFDDKPVDRGGASGSPGGDRSGRPPREKPHGDKLRAKFGRQDRPRRDQRDNGRPQDRPFSNWKGGPSASAQAGWKNRPPRERPHGDALRVKPGGEDRTRRDQRPDWRPPNPHRDDHPRGEKRPDARASQRQHGTRPGPSGPGSGHQGPRRPGPFGPGNMTERAPREKPHGDTLRKPASRPFAGHGRFERNQGTDEPKTPPVPSSPNHEPRPDENPEPSAPPHPDEPAILPPGPPERGASKKNRWRNR
jgi:hypothetical protein